MLDKFCMDNCCRGSGDLSEKAERPGKRHVCNSDWRCFQFAALEINHNHAQNCGQLKFRECLRTREIGIRISAADRSVEAARNVNLYPRKILPVVGSFGRGYSNCTSPTVCGNLFKQTDRRIDRCTVLYSKRGI